MIIDQAWTKQTVQTLKNNGISSVGMYLGQDNSGKNMNPSIVKEYSQNDISIFSLFEYGAAQATRGASQGRIDGALARQQCAANGQPSGSPVYFCVDFDIPDYAPSMDASTPNGARAKLGPIGDYFAALQQSFPLGIIGGYGGFYLVTRLYTAGLASWFIQTPAWSGGQVAPHLDLFQSGTMFNGQADVDIYESRGYNPDRGWGGWISTAVQPPVTTANIELLTNSGESQVKLLRGVGYTIPGTSIELVLESVTT